MKNVVLICLFVTFSLSAFAQTKLSGVVTYYYNEYQGNKPDIGASITLIDSTKTSGFDYELYKNFYYGKSYQNMYYRSLILFEKYTAALQKTRNNKKYDEDRKTYQKGIDDSEKSMNSHRIEMEKYGYGNAESSAKIDVNLYMQLLRLNEDLPKKSVDASGAYSIDIEPGVYYVYIKSKNRKGEGVTELDGKIYIKKVKIAENTVKDFSYNFEL